LATHVLFPGTFDPPTLGHLDLVTRAAQHFARVTVGLAGNPSKQALFTAEERLTLLRDCTASLANVSVALVPGLAVEACATLGCQAILRGLRSATDYDYEVQMAHTNRVLAPDVDTLFLPASAGVAHLSSTLVRQIASLGGDCSKLVPPNVNAALRGRFGKPPPRRKES